MQSIPLSADARALRRTIYEQFLQDGRSSNSDRIRAAAGLDREAFERALASLESGLMVMCVAGTRDIAKCPPWTNIPTRHRIVVDGVEVAFAGCALEAANVAYCYPGRAVEVHSVCPQTGAPTIITFENGAPTASVPEGVVCHVAVDPATWPENWFHACDGNTFFISAEAVSAWEAANPERAGVTLTVEQMATFAKYDYRLDFDRGGDPLPVSGGQMFAWIGIKSPAQWRAEGDAASAGPRSS